MPSSELSVMFWYVYFLRSERTEEHYVGFTKDLRKRFTEHNKGLNFSTRSGKPWELVYYEAHTNESDARRREKYLKTTSGRQALRKMTRDYLKTKRNLKLQKVYY